MARDSANYNRFLLDTIKESLKKSILSQPQKDDLSAFDRNFLDDLNDFIEKDGKAKEWLRARCLESAIASIGLEDYLSTAISFRGSSPSKTTPINVMFASNQIIRVLDPIALRLLEEKAQRNNHLPKEKWNALFTILKPNLDFTISKQEIYFDVDEIGYLRNLLLGSALDRLQFVADILVTSKDMKDNGPLLEAIGEIPGITLEKLLEVSKINPGLKITVERGFIKWKYAEQPTIYIYGNQTFFDAKELKAFNISFVAVERQIYLMKKAMFAKSLKQQQPRSLKRSASKADKKGVEKIIADEKIN